MISSLAEITFNKAYVFYGLDTAFQGSEDSITRTIKEAIPNAQVSSNRLLRLGDWKSFLVESGLLEGPDLIFYAGNDDHIFLDRNLDVLSDCVGMAEYAVRNIGPNASVYYSHWPEIMADWRGVLLRTRSASGTFTGRLPQEAAQIMSPALLRAFIFGEARDDDSQLRRTDEIGGVAAPGVLVRPHRELFRHFDAYSHVGISVSDFPPLSIPPGYFENQIKLNFDGAAEGAGDDWTNVNVLEPDHDSVRAKGARLFLTSDNIPLHWRGRISQTSDGLDSRASRSQIEDRKKLKVVGSVLGMTEPQITDVLAAAFNSRDNLPDSTMADEPRRLWSHKEYVGDGLGTALVIILKLHPAMLEFYARFGPKYREHAAAHGLELIFLIVGVKEDHNFPSFYMPISAFGDMEPISGVYGYVFPLFRGSPGVDPILALLRRLPHESVLVVEQKVYSSAIEIDEVMEALPSLTQARESIATFDAVAADAAGEVGLGVGGYHLSRAAVAEFLDSPRYTSFSQSVLQNFGEFLVTAGLGAKVTRSKATLRFVGHT